MSENPVLRYLSFSALYIAQGIPEGITFFAIPAWLAMHDKSPKEIASFVGGQKHGSWVSLDNRGQLSERAYYAMDKKNGLYIKYNRTRIKEERYYLHDLLHGTVKKYYDNGSIMEESNYNKRESTSKECVCS